jgi:Ion channel
MHGQIAIGVATNLANIAVHAVIMAVLIWTVRRAALATQAMKPLVRLIVVMTTTVAVLMGAHLVEIGIWGLAYAALGVAPQRVDSFYFAFVNYTTLGYGDLLPTEYWRLLGPMAAMNGVLLFGWSTAVIYDVLRTITRHDWPNHAAA